MKTKSLSIFFIILVLSSIVFACATKDFIPDEDAGFFGTWVVADPSNGFNYGYYYYIPNTLQLASKKYLLVIPNNSGGLTNYTIDSRQIHARAAQGQINSNKYLADELGVVLLVPAIPRPWSTPPDIEPQILNRVALQTSHGNHARVDLQLTRMIDDVKNICAGWGIDLEPKVLLNGFSASGNFGNRFTALHPDLVHAVVSGGVAGNPILPIDTIGEERLIYPVGIADLSELTGTSFNLQQYKTIPQFIFMGSDDTNDPLQSRHFWGDAERRIITMKMGTNMKERFEFAENVYKEQGINAIFKIYSGVGHGLNNQIVSNIIDFFRSNCEGVRGSI